MRRLVAGLLALVGWAALLLQYVIVLATTRAAGGWVIDATTSYFSYFTILTNLFVALTLTAELVTPSVGLWNFLARPSVRGAIATYVVVVAVVYAVALRGLWDPQGLQRIADVLLHNVMPVAYLTFWLAARRESLLRWHDAGVWLMAPALYLAWVLLRGVVVGRYPYPFVDVGRLGYAATAVNAGLLLAAFWVVGVAVVGADRTVGRRSLES